MGANQNQLTMEEQWRNFLRGEPYSKSGLAMANGQSDEIKKYIQKHETTNFKSIWCSFSSFRAKF